MIEPGARALRLQALAVAAAALAAFATSATNPFIPWDDDLYVSANPRVQRAGLEGLEALWSSDDVWGGRFIEFFPLRDSVYWATWQLFGNQPTAFHLVNIFAHALVALLVLRLGRRLGLSAAAAFWGALLFAVHPVHVESVTWVAALKDPMFTGLMVGSVLSFLSYRETGRARHYALCVVLMVAALLTKSIALATPVLLLIIERWLEPREPWRRSLARVAGPGVIALIFLIQFTLIGKITGIILPPHGGSWGQHYFLMGWALVRYVQQVVVPATFRIHYCFAPLESGFDLRLLAMAAVLVLSITALVFAWRRQRLMGVFILWFFACLLPVANLVPFPAIMADRYLYAPSVAACLLLGWGLTALTARRLVLGAIVAVLMTVTLGRGVIWKDHRNLWAEAIEDDVCTQDGEYSAMMMYLNHAKWSPDGPVALASYEKAFAHPRFKDVSVRDRVVYLRKAQSLALSLGKKELAERITEQAVRADPRDPYVWISRVALMGDDPQGALEAAEHAFKLARNADTYWILGLTRLEAGQAIGVNDLLMGVHLAPRTHCTALLGLLDHQLSQYSEQLSQVRRECEAGLARDAARAGQ